MKRWWYKLTHWEYWPVYIVYAPAAILWIFAMLRFRSFTFYKLANPAIINGGLYGDSKNDIYKLLPAETYPKTLLIDDSTDNNYLSLLSANALNFPLIVKPDIGCRGRWVQKVNNIEEIQHYKENIKQHFLIQEICDFPNEIGLFYCRLPGAKKGKITGLTLKNFLVVSGNGHNTIEELMMQVPRFRMQIAKLRKEQDLSEILPLHVQKCIVPFGNHNRGTEFIDGKNLISPKLEETFDKLLNKLEHFYFGRLDIRYNTLEELAEGKNYSIIELNGVKSEPTHIYDPSHSFWYGQKEIFRHQRILMDIVSKSYHQLSNQKE